MPRPLTAIARTLVAALAALILCGCQPRAPLFIAGGPDAPQVSPAALTRMGRALNLTESQRAQSADLYAAYAESHQRAARKYRDYQELAKKILEKDPDAPRVAARRDDASVKFAAHTGALADQFLEDLQLLLAREQLNNWEAALRALRRARSTGSAYAEKTADLRQALEAARPTTKPPRAAEIAATIDAWERAVDPVLIRKESFIRTTLAENLRADREKDNDARTSLYRRWRLIVRDERVVTTRALRELLTLLPEDAATGLSRAVQERTYPWLYQNTETLEVLQRAAAIDNLSLDAKRRIAELRAEYLRERLALADRTARDFEQWELSATDDEIAGADHPEPRPELIARFQQSEGRTTKGLADILTKAQLESINASTITRDLPPFDLE